MLRVITCYLDKLSFCKIWYRTHTCKIIVIIDAKLKHCVAIVLIAVYNFINVTLKTLHMSSLRC